METFGKICFAVLLIASSAILGGYVFMKLWEWMIVYAFNVQPLNFVQSLGVAFFWGYLSYKESKDKDSTWEELVEKFFKLLIQVGVILGLGYLITLLH